MSCGDKTNDENEFFVTFAGGVDVDSEKELLLNRYDSLNFEDQYRLPNSQSFLANSNSEDYFQISTEDTVTVTDRYQYGVATSGNENEEESISNWSKFFINQNDTDVWESQINNLFFFSSR